jgi:transposase
MVVVKDHQQREPSMSEIITIGLDLAKNIFQVHGVDTTGTAVVTKRLRRNQVIGFFADLRPCLIGMEACATAHHWARRLIGLGHEVRLMPPQYVKAYVKRNKNDAADAEAICEAVKRPCFLPIKTIEQQSALLMHRARDLLIRQRTMLVNALRGHMAEFGLVEAQGLHKVAGLIAIVMDDGDERIPDIARQATAIAATVADASVFRSGREFAAWLGLVPRQNSTGGKARLGGISKRGDSYLRRLIVNSAHTVLLCAKVAKVDPWIVSLRGRRLDLSLLLHWQTKPHV